MLGRTGRGRRPVAVRGRGRPAGAGLGRRIFRPLWAAGFVLPVAELPSWDFLLEEILLSAKPAGNLSKFPRTVPWRSGRGGRLHCARYPMLLKNFLDE